MNLNVKIAAKFSKLSALKAKRMLIVRSAGDLKNQAGAAGFYQQLTLQ